MSAQYRNPVIPGSHADPSVCRVGDDYYLACSSFEFFPGVPLFHSRDLVNWRAIGHALTRDSQLDLHGCKSSLGIFAPTLRHIGGRFHLVTTNLNKFSNFIVSADRAEGSWSEPLWLDWPGIDPSLFEDADGRVYISGNGGFLGDEPAGIYQAEIDLATGALKSPRRLVWPGTGGKAPEGPHLYRRGGFYYLLIAEGGTEYGHMVTVARSAQPMGPFEACPRNPILSHRSLDSPIQATGHADLVEAADGHWWAVFLGIRPAPVRFAGLHHHLGRETFLAPVTWTDDGWPVIGQQGRVFETMDAGTLPLQPPAARSTSTTFSGTTLPPEFNHLRNPQPGSWSLQARPGWLTLQGQPDTLDDVAAPAFVGRRQQHFDCTVTTLLDFEPAADGEEAGLTVFKNERFHYEIAVGRRDSQRVVFLRRRLGSLWKVEREQPLPHGELLLGLRADAQHYRFFFQRPGQAEQAFGTGECALLSTEVAGGFTGVYLGLYATGNGRHSAAPACFRGLDYRDTTP
ncbi:glycoside hydrolase family 43 protein [Roseateles sp. BYS78W]|uniref:Glycoside hydrolase family 43 protein n=1 Tax=Pelomonas candidula TaxID=3299025 RepID=A0ABW7HIU1_9BURK